MDIDFDPMKYPTDLTILKAWLLNRGLTVEMQEHKMYTEGCEFSPTLARLAGTDHIITESDFGVISVIRGFASFGDYEICCLAGDLFEDVERYPDVKSCGERIYQLLIGETNESRPQRSSTNGE